MCPEQNFSFFFKFFCFTYFLHGQSMMCSNSEWNSTARKKHIDFCLDWGQSNIDNHREDTQLVQDDAYTCQNDQRVEQNGASQPSSNVVWGEPGQGDPHVCWNLSVLNVFMSSNSFKVARFHIFVYLSLDAIDLIFSQDANRRDRQWRALSLDWFIHHLIFLLISFLHLDDIVEGHTFLLISSFDLFDNLGVLFLDSCDVLWEE